MQDNQTDRRAHRRIDDLWAALETHLKDHARIETAIKENTRITIETAESVKRIDTATESFVEMHRGAEGLRKFILWLWPFVIVLIGIFLGAIAYLKGK